MKPHRRSGDLISKKVQSRKTEATGSTSFAQQAIKQTLAMQELAGGKTGKGVGGGFLRRRAPPPKKKEKEKEPKKWGPYCEVAGQRDKPVRREHGGEGGKEVRG